MSRYYVAKDARSWPGVCEVPDGQIRNYYHHREWPRRATELLPFMQDGGSYASCTHPTTGWWQPMFDEDFIMDEGL